MVRASGPATLNDGALLVAKKGKKKAHAVVFTGVQSIQMAQFAYIDEVLDALKAAVFISGGASGIDTYCCCEAVRRFPKADHFVVNPYNYKGNDVHLAWCASHDVRIIRLGQPKRATPHPNIIRNEYMISLALEFEKKHKLKPLLVAFPGQRQEVLRSGTWSTIRRARAANIPVQLNPLSEANGQLHGGIIEL